MGKPKHSIEEMQEHAIFIIKIKYLALYMVVVGIGMFLIRGAGVYAFAHKGEVISIIIFIGAAIVVPALEIVVILFIMKMAKKAIDKYR